jgi:DNA-binding phage protein
MRGVLRDDLTQAAEEVRQAVAAAEEARARLRATILRAFDEGIPIASIARWTGLTRETVYRYRDRALRERAEAADE